MIEIFESYQLALFLREPSRLDALKLWDIALGQSPTGFQTVAPGHTQAQGNLGELDVVFVVQAAGARVDLHVSGHADGGPAPAIQDPKAALAQGIDLLRKVVAELAIGRAAAVLEGHVTAADSIDASLKVKAFVPDLPLPEKAEDATYRIVVPLASKSIPNRRLNQICQWQAVQIQFLQLAPPAPPTSTSKKFAAHAHIDVFGVGMLVMTSEQAIAELEEVSSRAMEVLYGGYNELR